LAARVRSGLVETTHDGTVAVVGADGQLLAWSGDIDRPFFLRSAAKPFQATVAQISGADLAPAQLAVAAGSHDALPVHVVLVAAMLEERGLTVADLQCPASWPLSQTARDILVAAGHDRPQPIWHNCSGKHAAWLRACVASGWPTATYLEPDHPLQRLVIDLVSDLGGLGVEPVGVDGCGAPVLRTTARAMSTLYARLGNDPELSEVFSAMHTYPVLASGPGNADAVLAIAGNLAAKRGAEGCLGASISGGPGIAVKAWDGIGAVAENGMVACLRRLQVGGSYPAQRLADLDQPVLGGGVPVGRLESRLELSWS
jgi:L-asparaginase II